MTQPAAPLEPRWVRCPACGQRSLYAVENAARPFCSARCRSADFGAWASEDYRLAAAPAPEGDGPDPASGSAH